MKNLNMCENIFYLALVLLLALGHVQTGRVGGGVRGVKMTWACSRHCLPLFPYLFFMLAHHLFFLIQRLYLLRAEHLGTDLGDRIVSNLSQQILHNLTILFSQNLASSYLIEIKQVILQNTCVLTVECTFCRTEAT